MKLLTKKSRNNRLVRYKIILNQMLIKYIQNGSVGDLNLRGTPITELPDNLTEIGGTLDISFTNLKKLPNIKFILRHLILDGTSISVIPDNLTIGGYLDADMTLISTLPPNLYIGGDLWCRHTPLSQNFNNLKLVCTINGYINK